MFKLSMFQKVLLRAFGAELVLTDPSMGMTGAIQRALELAQSLPDTYVLHQVSSTIIFDGFRDYGIILPSFIFFTYNFFSLIIRLIPKSTTTPLDQRFGAKPKAKWTLLCLEWERAER